MSRRPNYTNCVSCIVRSGGLICAAVIGLRGSSSEARVTQLQVVSRETVADGVSFGSVGPYEKLRGTVFFEVDPSDSHNTAVFDIDKAPQSTQGTVTFSADFFILKPLDLSKGNLALFYEAGPQGQKRAFAFFHDADSRANINNPSVLSDFGNGFLLKQGYTLAWVGWQTTVPSGLDLLRVTFPIAMDHGQPITERVITEFANGDGRGGTPFTQALRFVSVSTDATVAEAEIRRRPSDSPRPSAPEIPEGEIIPTSEWSFASCPTGPPGTPSPNSICLRGGFQTNLVYQLIYRAMGSPISGLGYLTTRDFVSFLQYSRADEVGNPNPIYGLGTVLGYGASQGAHYWRDYIYQGFNEDESGRMVFAGVQIQSAGVRKLPLNYRFGFGPPASLQHSHRFWQEDTFPWTFAVRPDSVTGRLDGILKRPATDPKIISTDPANEYWIGRASLVDTDEDGTQDLEQPSNLRRYLFASTQHAATKGDPPSYGIGDRQCQQLSNITHIGPFARALLTALEAWVRTGKEPPPSQIPRIQDGTLVPPSDTGFPNIPGVTYNGLYNASALRDFGPRVTGNSGVVDYLIPHVLRVNTVLVPLVDSVGNDVAGLRHPFVEAPVATLTGWNLRRPEFTDGDLCDLLGMSIPLPRTEAERVETEDPRPSLEALYGDHRGYVRAVSNAARNLYRRGFMLRDDVDLVVEEAEAFRF